MTGIASALSGDLRSIQAGFVDEPRNAVEEADHFVASAMKRLADVVRRGASQARARMGSRRQCIDRRSPDRAEAIPVIL